MKTCIICGSISIKISEAKFPGYIEGTFYEIFCCHDCNSSFIDPDKIDKTIYEKIYSFPDLIRYDRYYKYAMEIRTKKDPLKYLSQIESVYFPVYKNITEKNQRILEVGCSYGYLTYAINQSGNSATGIDISAKAIDFAKQHFGNNYLNISVEEFAAKYDEKYDMIISTEVIEHLENPVLLLEQLKGLLSKNGKIILTTPNKDFASKKFTWLTDSPPVHVTWLSKKSFIKIAAKLGFKIEFTSYKNYYPSEENRLFKYLYAKISKETIHLLSKNGKPLIHQVSKSRELLKKIIWTIMYKFMLIRVVSNFFYNVTIEKDITLGIILQKKP